MDRRTFLALSGAAGLAAVLPTGCAAPPSPSPQAYAGFAGDLLLTWTDALLALQVDVPEDPARHGVIWCPACDKVHGRCLDAVYPFLHAYAKTQHERYLTAAIRLMDWAETLTLPDGSWTVIPNPKSWRGTTVFGAISLAETLKYHGSLLPKKVREQWTKRLGRAAEYLFHNFNLTFTHINYGGTAIYALWLIGEVLDRPDYQTRSRELAIGIRSWFTPHDTLLFGEDKPSTEASAKGLLPVDLGYNVEETLSALALYAQAADDEALTQLLVTSWRSHLRFMLPDGAWDNSWGLRQNKWTYWGSRTCDGSQVGLAALHQHDPSFVTALWRNTELLAACTSNGLLAGGPHYQSAGVPACIHHSFTHAKALASVLNHHPDLPQPATGLPREAADGLTHVRDVDVWLCARGPWCATVSAYDQVFKRPDSQAAAGASLAVLYHEVLGPICLASMADYVLVERNNMQPLINPDVALTPRLEVMYEGVRYTNLYDLNASIQAHDEQGVLGLTSEVRLVNADREALPQTIFRLTYRISTTHVTLQATPASTRAQTLEAQLILPLVCPSPEQVSQLSDRTLRIRKGTESLSVASDVPMTYPLGSFDARTFNHVPGVQAVVLALPINEGASFTLFAT